MRLWGWAIGVLVAVRLPGAPAPGTVAVDATDAEATGPSLYGRAVPYVLGAIVVVGTCVTIADLFGWRWFLAILVGVALALSMAAEWARADPATRLAKIAVAWVPLYFLVFRRRKQERGGKDEKKRNDE